jgi:hypothetical protein
MKKETNLTTGISEPEKVDMFITELKHPLRDVVEYLRGIILSIDKKIGEGIYWNAPTFYYTGKMKPFSSKEYKRYIAGFNLFKKDCIRLIFLRGSSAKNGAGLLEGDYKDGRRIALFYSVEDVKTKEKDLKKVIKELLKSINSF